jgi:hypothetical protein
MLLPHRLICGFIKACGFAGLGYETAISGNYLLLKSTYATIIVVIMVNTWGARYPKGITAQYMAPISSDRIPADLVAFITPVFSFN